MNNFWSASQTQCTTASQPQSLAASDFLNRRRTRKKFPQWEAAHFQKNPRVRNIFCPQFWGRKWLRQFYGRLENFWFFLQEKPMSIKFLLLGGGGRECPFYFYGREDFSDIWLFFIAKRIATATVALPQKNRLLESEQACGHYLQSFNVGGLTIKFTLNQKNPRVRKISVRNSGAGNGCANFMDTWKNASVLQEKPCP